MSAKSASPRTVNLLYMITSLVLMAISIPLLLEKVGPNGIYGFRIEKTMSDPKIWYAANKVLGQDLLIATCVMLLTTLAIFVFGKGLSTNKVAIINLVIFLGSLAIAIGHSYLVVAAM